MTPNETNTPKKNIGLKLLAGNRKHKNKTHIPKDKDGAFRLANRLDGLSPQEAIYVADGGKITRKLN